MKFKAFSFAAMRILTGETVTIHSVMISDETPMERTIIGDDLLQRRWESWESEEKALKEARAEVAGRLARIAGAVEELQHALTQPPERVASAPVLLGVDSMDS
jgi:hypothetical protein